MLDEEEKSILNKLINPDKSIKLTTLDYTKPDDNEELLVSIDELIIFPSIK